MKAMILAAGYGTRLGALTQRLPKPMLPLGDEPLIVYTIRYLASHGFDDLVINLHFQGRLVADFLGDGSSLGVRIAYSWEKELLGTAGGVRNVLDSFRGSREFLVIYGDLLIDQDLGAMVDFHRKRGAAATLFLHRRQGSNSLVEMDDAGRIVAFIERPTEEERRRNPYPWVNSGVQLLTPLLLARLVPGSFADLPKDVYIPNLRELPIFGFPLTGFRIAIDSPERYARARRAVLDGRYKPPFRVKDG